MQVLQRELDTVEKEKDVFINDFSEVQFSSFVIHPLLTKYILSYCFVGYV